MHIYHQIVEEKERLVQQINSLEKKIAKLPNGKLISVHNEKLLEESSTYSSLLAPLFAPEISELKNQKL